MILYKKIFCVITLIALSMGLFGCQQQTGEQDLNADPTAEQSTNNPYTVLLYEFKKEYDFADTEKYANINMPEQMTVKIEDKNITGEFKVCFNNIKRRQARSDMHNIG